VPAILYNRDILRLAASIPYLGRLDAADGSADRRSPLCGSEVVADVRLGDDDRIDALGLEVRACALGQASAALMAHHAIGRDRAALMVGRDQLSAYLSERRDDPGDWPGLAALAPARDYPSRHSSILLAFDAVIAAIGDALVRSSSPASPQAPR